MFSADTESLATTHEDPLLDCLLAVSRLHGNATTRSALTAGLPLAGKVLPPSLFNRAAARAGLASKVVRRALTAIPHEAMPVILLLQHNKACVLVGWSEDMQTAHLLLPETGQGTVDLSAADLAERYTGVAIVARPKFRFDRRTPELGRVKVRHWFWGALLDQWPLYRDVLLAAALINTFALAMPIFTMNVYDRVVPNHATETLWFLGLGVGLVVTADLLLRLARARFVDLASKRIDLNLSARIMERILGMRMEARPASVGSFAANLRAFESVRELIASATVTAMVDLPFALIFISVLVWISWPLVLPLLIGMLLITLYALIVQHRMHDLSETTYRAAALRNATLIESLSGLETIKAHGGERRMQARWEQTAHFLAKTDSELKMLSTSITTATGWMQQMISVVVIVFGVYLIHDGQLTTGGLIAGTQLASRAMAPLGALVGLLMQYHTARTSLRSLENLMELPIERADASAFIHRDRIQGEIEFRNVNFRYPNSETLALRGVSLKIKPGEKVAIIGKIGSGKTTLEKLLLGLYQPESGAVLVDGVDVRQLDPAELRHQIGYVSQDVTLFYGTLRDNITLGSPNVEHSSVVLATEIAGLTEFVNAHPKGFDMPIGERGDTLSGGQKQSVGIARAVLADPPILLLDEPSSGMDFSTEANFKNQLAQFAAHKTVLLVTHRTSLLDLAERLIVIDQGQIVADGPRDQVAQDLQNGRVGRASV